MKKFMKYGVLLACGILLAACGGGGDSVSVVSSNPGPGPGPLPSAEYYAVNFTADVAEVSFGDNAVGFGLIDNVDPADVRDVQWRGNSAGWTDGSTAIGVLWKDASGMVHATVANMPKSDQGNFVVRMKNGEVVWFNGGIWNVMLNGKASPDAQFDEKLGQFNYTM